MKPTTPPIQPTCTMTVPEYANTPAVLTPVMRTKDT
uniref:Uncharacterized protein n=1 Tax=Rhizophora mucronata TaxID=61149 RepID=A0A2P2IKU5_RHIMU